MASYLQRTSFGVSAKYSGLSVPTVKCASEKCGTSQAILVILFFLPMRLWKTGNVQVQLEVYVLSLASIYCRRPNTFPFPTNASVDFRVHVEVCQTFLDLESQSIWAA